MSELPKTATGNVQKWAKSIGVEIRPRIPPCAEKLRAQNVASEELIFPDEIHDLLRGTDWVRAHRATAEFFDRKLAGSGERQ